MRNTQRIGVVLVITMLSILLASLYGVFHDQLSYTFSPEYYTKFKFQEFGLVDEKYPELVPVRVQVALTGVIATWWMGLGLGFIIALVSLRFNQPKLIIKRAMRSVSIIVLYSSVFALIGLSVGELFSHSLSDSSFVPVSVIDKQSFVAVGMMHNGSYLGAVIGFIVVLWQIRRVLKARALGLPEGDVSTLEE